jgi:hypothetical protein
MFIMLPSGGLTEDVLIGIGHKGGHVYQAQSYLLSANRTAHLKEGNSFQIKCDTTHNIANHSVTEITAMDHERTRHSRLAAGGQLLCLKEYC